MAAVAVFGARSQPPLGSCYYPGSVWARNEHPCNLHSEVSLCCPTGWTCFSNDLCIVTDSDAASADIGTTSRGTCTNPDWDKDACGNFCLDDEDGSMTACGNNTWCCSSDVKSGKCNCDSGKGTFNVPKGKAVAQVGFVHNQITVTTGTAVPTSTGPVVKPSTLAAASSSSSSSSGAATSSSSSSSSAASSSATAASSSSNQKQASSSSSSPPLAKILGPIFGVLAFLALLALAFFLWRRRKRNRRSPNPSPEPSHGPMSIDTSPSKVPDAFIPPPRNFNERPTYGGPSNAHGQPSQLATTTFNNQTTSPTAHDYYGNAMPSAARNFNGQAAQPQRGSFYEPPGPPVPGSFYRPSPRAAVGNGYDRPRQPEAGGEATRSTYSEARNIPGRQTHHQAPIPRPIPPMAANPSGTSSNRNSGYTPIFSPRSSEQSPSLSPTRPGSSGYTPMSPPGADRNSRDEGGMISPAAEPRKSLTRKPVPSNFAQS